MPDARPSIAGLLLRDRDRDALAPLGASSTENRLHLMSRGDAQAHDSRRVAGAMAAKTAPRRVDVKVRSHAGLIVDRSRRIRAGSRNSDLGNSGNSDHP